MHFMKQLKANMKILHGYGLGIEKRVINNKNDILRFN